MAWTSAEEARPSAAAEPARGTAGSKPGFVMCCYVQFAEVSGLGKTFCAVYCAAAIQQGTCTCERRIVRAMRGNYPSREGLADGSRAFPLLLGLAAAAPARRLAIKHPTCCSARTWRPSCRAP